MKELENFYKKLCKITDCNTELTIDSAELKRYMVSMGKI